MSASSLKKLQEVTKNSKMKFDNGSILYLSGFRFEVGFKFPPPLDFVMLNSTVRLLSLCFFGA